MTGTQMNIPVSLVFQGAWAQNPVAKHFKENSEYALIAIDGAMAYVVADRCSIQAVPLNYVSVITLSRPAVMPSPTAPPKTAPPAESVVKASEPQTKAKPSAKASEPQAKAKPPAKPEPVGANDAL